MFKIKSTVKKAHKRADGKIVANGRVMTDQAYQNKKDYQNEYNKINYRQYAVRFRKKFDVDIIMYLNSKDNVSKYLRELVTIDMQKNKQA